MTVLCFWIAHTVPQFSSVLFFWCRIACREIAFLFCLLEIPKYWIVFTKQNTKYSFLDYTNCLNESQKSILHPCWQFKFMLCHPLFFQAFYVQKVSKVTMYLCSLSLIGWQSGECVQPEGQQGAPGPSPPGGTTPTHSGGWFGPPLPSLILSVHSRSFQFHHLIHKWSRLCIKPKKPIWYCFDDGFFYRTIARIAWRRLSHSESSYAAPFICSVRSRLWQFCLFIWQSGKLFRPSNCCNMIPRFLI